MLHAFSFFQFCRRFLNCSKCLLVQNQFRHIVTNRNTSSHIATHDNITKTYKHGSEDTIDEIDSELKYISNNLGIGDKNEKMKKREAFISLKDHKENFDTIDEIDSELKDISNNLGIGDKNEKMKKREAFISLKDHKENFENNPKCRLINPAKSESGKLSKIILDGINSNLRQKLNLNQWRNTKQVIEWFGNIKDKERHSFISFDIVDFYPSISEKLLDQALSWASNLTTISDNDILIIKHARKSLLFNTGKPWTKKDSEGLFDITMGSHDGAEICELVGLFILNHLSKKFGKESIGLYRDDGLALIKSKSARVADKTRKELHKIFELFDLKVTAESNLRIVNFLDVTFDLIQRKI